MDFIVYVTYECKPRRSNSCNAFGREKCPSTMLKPVHMEEVVREESSKGVDW